MKKPAHPTKPLGLTADEFERREELARRIKAARALRQISQVQLGRLAEADGLNRYDLAQIEQRTRTMLRVHREALVRHLRVPERWLTAETVDEAVGYEDPEEQKTTLEAAANDLRELRDRLDTLDIKHEVHAAFEEYASRLGARIGKLPPRSKRNPDRPPQEPPTAA